MKKRQESIGISATLLAGVAGLTSLHCGAEGAQVGVQRQAIRIECATESDDADPSQWQCPESLAVQCSELAEASLLVSSPADQMCDPEQLRLTYPEPLLPGSHVIEVRDSSDALLCVSEAVVTRGAGLQLLPKTVKLWPPNHKLHTVSVEDCVEIVGACPGEELQASFTWVSSDEPMDAKGDGNHAPDVSVDDDCQRLQLRSERQGGSDGRVYALGVRVVDGEGEAYEGVCNVSVDHDRSGADALTSGEAYRLTLDGTDGSPDCSEPGLGAE